MRHFLAILILLLSVGAVRADITSNLVAHWKLDETSGTSAADSSGSGYTGTYTNSPTLNETGAFGSSKAVTFASASSQYVTFTPASILQNKAAMSVACWLKYTTSGGQYVVFASINGSSAQPRLALFLNAGKIECRARGGDGESFQAKTTTTTYHDGAYHHICGVVDVANDTIVIYVDGSAVSATGTIAFTATATDNTSSSFGRLSGNGSGALFLDGTLDDVRIYSRALSADDVAELYAYTGAAKFPYWYFNSSGCDPFKVFRTRQPLAIVTTR